MPHDPEQTVRALFDAFAARDVDAGIAVLHPQVELWAQPTAELAQRQEPHRGHDGWREYLAEVDRVWDAFRVDPVDYRVAGAGVICFGTATGTPAGSDQERRVPVIWVFRLREGRVVFCRVANTAAEAHDMAEEAA